MLNLRSNLKKQSFVYLRGLEVESLEARCLLAADVFAFQNPVIAMDVTHDSIVTPADALAIVNALNGFDLFDGKVGAYLDTTGDNSVAPNDVIGIINLLNGATNTEEAEFEAQLEFASEYCESNFADIAAGLKPVAQQFIEATNNLVRSNVLRDAALTSFLGYSLDNNAAVIARYRDIEMAVGVIDKEYRQKLQQLGVGLTELVNANYPNDPTAIDEYPDQYDFDPDAFDDIEDVFDELFNEIDGFVGEIELPDYGDVIDNFENVFQTYDDSGFGLDEFVGEFLETDDYDDFVLEGHDFGELLSDIGNIYETGMNLDEFVRDEFGTTAELEPLLEGMLKSTYFGELVFNEFAAIGGETTGSNVILIDGSVVEIDLGDDPDLLASARTYDNTNVLIEGVAELVSGVEIPNRIVIDVTTLVGQQELETLELLLLSDRSSVVSTVLSQFVGILTS